MTQENMPVFDLPSGPDTALQQAVEQRDSQLVSLLLAAGAWPMEGTLRKMPLHGAASDPEILALLLAELEAQEENPKWAYTASALQSTLSRTLSDWTNFSARMDQDGSTARDCSTCFQMLVEFGAVLDLDDVGFAIDAGEIEETQFQAWYLDQLVTRQPDGLLASYWLEDLIDDQDIDGLRALLDAGLDVNAVGENGRTPLHFAIFEDDAALVSFLLERGASVNKQDSAGETALDWAHDDGVIAALREAGGVYSDAQAE